MKGVISAVKSLALMIIFLLVIVAFGVPIVQKAFGEILGQGKQFPSVQTPLTAAAACAYFRCTQGCRGPDVALDCYNKYCKDVPDMFKVGDKENFKMCSWVSQQFPAEEKIGTVKQLTKESFNTECVIHSTMASSFEELNARGYNLVVVEDQLVKSPTIAKCKAGEVEFENAIERFDLEVGGSVYAEAFHKDIVFGKQNTIYIKSKPEYIRLPVGGTVPNKILDIHAGEKGVEIITGLPYSGWYRVALINQENNAIENSFVKVDKDIGGCGALIGSAKLFYNCDSKEFSQCVESTSKEYTFCGRYKVRFNGWNNLPFNTLADLSIQSLASLSLSSEGNKNSYKSTDEATFTAELKSGSKPLQSQKIELHVVIAGFPDIPTSLLTTCTTDKNGVCKMQIDLAGYTDKYTFFARFGQISSQQLTITVTT